MSSVFCFSLTKHNKHYNKCNKYLDKSHLKPSKKQTLTETTMTLSVIIEFNGLIALINITFVYSVSLLADEQARLFGILCKNKNKKIHSNIYLIQIKL